MFGSFGIPLAKRSSSNIASEGSPVASVSEIRGVHPGCVVWSERFGLREHKGRWTQTMYTSSDNNVAAKRLLDFDSDEPVPTDVALDQIGLLVKRRDRHKNALNAIERSYGIEWKDADKIRVTIDATTRDRISKIR